MTTNKNGIKNLVRVFVRVIFGIPIIIWGWPFLACAWVARWVDDVDDDDVTAESLGIAVIGIVLEIVWIIFLFDNTLKVL